MTECPVCGTDEELYDHEDCEEAQQVEPYEGTQMEIYEITCGQCGTEFTVTTRSEMKLHRNFKCSMCGHVNRDWLHGTSQQPTSQHDTSLSPAPQSGVEHF